MKCKICELFDCGKICKCVCHCLGSSDLIKYSKSPSYSAQVKPITTEDIELVAQQCDVSFETAKRSLEQTKGDLAKAILLLS